MSKSYLPDDDRSVLDKACQDVGVPTELVVALIEEESSVYGMGRRHGIRERIDMLLARFCEEA
jgi:hypothetical protein